MTDTDDNALGTYLRDRRTRLDPTAFGFPAARRRTPGLRREEVAQRANVSATWYTWLEQGRGGAPSPETLERIAAALLLSDVEREYLFLLALGHPPEVRYQAVAGGAPSLQRLQRVLDGMPLSPAFVKTATWDVLAWNRAAAAVLTDYGALPPAQRNIMRLVFCNAEIRAAQQDWESVARLMVAAFRADTARAGASKEVSALVEELLGCSPTFAAMWGDHDVRPYGEGVKRRWHPSVGLIGLEYSAFVVDGQPGLGMVVFNPATPADAERIRTLVGASSPSSRV